MTDDLTLLISSVGHYVETMSLVSRWWISSVPVGKMGVKRGMEAEEIVTN